MLGLALVWRGPKGRDGEKLKEWVAIGDGSAVNAYRGYS